MERFRSLDLPAKNVVDWRESGKSSGVYFTIIIIPDPEHPTAIIFPSPFPPRGRMEEMGSLEMPGPCFCVRICLMGGPDTNEAERAGEGRGGRAKEPTNMPEQSDTTSRADTYPCRVRPLQRQAATATARLRRPCRRWMTDGTNNLSFRSGVHDLAAVRDGEDPSQK